MKTNKQNFIAATLALALVAQASASDVVVYKKTETKSIVEESEVASTSTGLKAARYRNSETIFLVIDLTNERYVEVDVLAKDPNHGGVKTYYVSSIVNGIPFKRIPLRPSGELWYAVGVGDLQIAEDTDDDSEVDYVSTVLQGYYDSGRASLVTVAPSRQVLLAPTITVTATEFEQFTDAFEDTAGSKALAVTGSLKLDRKLTRTVITAAVPTLESGLAVLEADLVAKGHLDKTE